MIRGDERHWAEMVLDVIENVECHMLMYEGEKMIVRKALKAYLETDTQQTEQTCDTCAHQGELSEKCRTCGSNWEARDTPQTEQKTFDVRNEECKICRAEHIKYSAPLPCEINGVCNGKWKRSE